MLSILKSATVEKQFCAVNFEKRDRGKTILLQSVILSLLWNRFVFEEEKKKILAGHHMDKNHLLAGCDVFFSQNGGWLNKNDWRFFWLVSVECASSQKFQCDPWITIRETPDYHGALNISEATADAFPLVLPLKSPRHGWSYLLSIAGRYAPSAAPSPPPSFLNKTVFSSNFFFKLLFHPCFETFFFFLIDL